MTKLSVAMLALTLCAGAAWADPVEGTWKTEVDDGAYALVGVKPCGANYCGTIDRTFNDTGEYKSPNLGKTLVIDMAPEGNGKYRGQVWRPSNNKIYMGKMLVEGDALQLSGCVAGGLLCSKQKWARVK
ncbi:DUF2147 domain-containing protein [Puniceibacterium sediminis]|uniref:Uncharacterized conserved protein, DUF2147 family n=1 Tax=Puniceibacterium sediminis TaxID=1608407 RepID=A0A238UVR6_9RHOB|nr:DUF2147 domain-containing protein [Puniceibacterium sediminis]SNR26315.1 Uncharacterized conserved protein, DUF2147 family [Puniceibacterium sediminis]